MNTKKKVYKWASPYEWLAEVSQGWPLERCRVEMLNLAIKHDSDTLQTEYESEMDEDGYFNETEA